MSKTAEEMLKEELVASGITMWIWNDVNEEVMPIYVSAMRRFAAQEGAKEIEAYKDTLKSELQSRLNGTRGLEHLSFEDISEIIDTVK